MSRWRAIAAFAALLVFSACDGAPVVGSEGPPDAARDVADVTDTGPTCPSPLVACSGRCTDPASDRENCGACGRACGTGNVC